MAAVLAVAVCGCGKKPESASVEGEETPAAEVNAVIIPIDDEIVYATGVRVKRELQRAAAQEPKPDYIIVEIDSPGGLVDVAVEICKMIDGVPEGVRTVAYITRRAWSAAALVAIACDSIYTTPDGSIGAAGTLADSLGVTTAPAKKFISALRAEFRARAENNGHNPYVAEAMVDEDIEVIEILIAGNDGFELVDRYKADELVKAGSH